MEREHKKVTESFESQAERMNALRNVNRQLEARSEDIRVKCESLLYLQDRCAQLEAKCEEQAKLLQMTELDRIKSSHPENYDEELTKK